MSKHISAVLVAKKYYYDIAARMFDSIHWSDNGRYLHTSVTVYGKKYSVCKHVLVHYMHTGELPEAVDHIDGDTYNNEPSNLRSATALQNKQSRRLNSNNTSGIKGVEKKGKKWCARLRIGNGKRLFVGSFNTPEEADRALREARDKYHGAFAKHG